MHPMGGSDEQRLDALFRAYHEACPTPEASANFMPKLWAGIESRQRFTFSFSRMANGFVTAALALSIALGMYMYMPHANTSYSESYIEALAEARPIDAPEIVGTVSLEISDRGR
jgi:ABC-type nitrate/sulfonate/bicarbonate transport system permease component